jgi:hypothetical protein
MVLTVNLNTWAGTETRPYDKGRPSKEIGLSKPANENIYHQVDRKRSGLQGFPPTRKIGYKL